MAPAIASQKLEELLPAETGMMVVIDDVPALRAAWPELPLVKAFKDPEIRAFLAPSLEEGQEQEWEEFLEKPAGQELDELLKLITGQAAVVIPDLAELGEAFDDDDDEGFAIWSFMAVVGENGPAVSAKMSAAFDSSEEEEGWSIAQEELAGETVYVRRLVQNEVVVDEMAWAVVDGVAVLAEPRSYLEKLIGAVKEGPQGASLAAHPPFATLKDRTPDGAILGYVNLKSLLAMLLQVMEEQAAKEEPNALGLTPDMVFRGLGLDALEASAVSVNLGMETTRMDWGLLASEDRGIMKAMTFLPPEETLPSFLPATAVQVGAGYFDVQAFWATLKEILQGINPMLAMMAEAQIQQLSAQLGVDLEKSLVGNLGQVFASAAFMATAADTGRPASLEEMAEISVSAVNDIEEMNAAVKALMSLFDPEGNLFEARELAGTTVHTLKEPIPSGVEGSTTTLSYAFKKGHLLVCQGSVETLEKMLANMDKPGPAIWSRPDVRAALAQLPAGASMVQFQDSAKVLAGVLEMMVPYIFIYGTEEGEEPPVDPQAMPSEELLRRYFGSAVTGLYKTGGDLSMTWRLQHGGS
jgi:hypothetical protein